MATASELETIIAFVVTTLRAIPGVGHCYDYEPVATQGEMIPTLLKDAGWVNYWFVECLSTSEAWMTNREILLTHDLVMKGYGEVQDAAVSGPAFRVLTSHIADVFRPHYTVPDVTSAELLGPAQTPTRGVLVLLAETFVTHHSELRLRATERVSLI
jgi:hypothetical protein